MKLINIDNHLPIINTFINKTLDVDNLKFFGCYAMNPKMNDIMDFIDENHPTYDKFSTCL
jgi:hypothetical protein